jgi:hypothetical protein
VLQQFVDREADIYETSIDTLGLARPTSANDRPMRRGDPTCPGGADLCAILGWFDKSHVVDVEWLI